MKNVIYKYPILAREENSFLLLPTGAKILAIQTQGDAISLWAQVDPKEKGTHTRFIKRIATGQEFDSQISRTYISTVQEGPFVWHYFEIL